MMRNTTILGAVALLGLLASPSFATVTIVSDNSDPQAILNYGNIYTTGADMDGMKVTVTYADATTQVFTWATTVTPGGGVSGGGFSLDYPGSDTYFASPPWTLSNTGKAITDVKLDGFPGLTLFDQTNPDPGTANSPGQTFTLLSGATNEDLTVTYSGPIGVDGAPPIGPPTDVYRWLDIAFSTPYTGTLTYQADTDNFGEVAPTGVPEPAPMMIMGLGVLMMGGLIARKRLGFKS